MARAKVKIGIIFDQDPHNGGGFTQAIAHAQAACCIDEKVGEAVFYTFKEAQSETLRQYNITSTVISVGMTGKISSVIRKSLRRTEVGVAILKALPPGRVERALIRDNVDLAYYLSPSQWSGDFKETSFISTFWDNAHREHMEFPEVYRNEEFEARELAYSSQLKKAVAVIAESEQSKMTLTREYGVKPERVFVTELIPALGLEKGVRTSAERDNYILYPAQLWPHKNHVYIIDTLKALRDRGIEVRAMFAGSDKGNKDFLVRYASKLGVSENIDFRGFVSSRELSELYRDCLCVAMPSYFGPSNVPPLEAQMFGKKVYLPDIEGVRNQLESGFELFDTEDPQSLCAKIERQILEGNGEEGVVIEDIRKKRLEKSKENLEEIARRYGIKKGTWSM